VFILSRNHHHAVKRQRRWLTAKNRLSQKKKQKYWGKVGDPGARGVIEVMEGVGNVRDATELPHAPATTVYGLSKVCPVSGHLGLSGPDKRGPITSERQIRKMAL